MMFLDILGVVVTIIGMAGSMFVHAALSAVEAGRRRRQLAEMKKLKYRRTI